MYQTMMRLALILSLVLTACSFDSAKLDVRKCGSEAECPNSTEVCCAGYCVLASSCTSKTDYQIIPRDLSGDYDPAQDPDGDGVLTKEDNCPTIYNPDQADSDDDGVGNLCDCSPTDKNYSKTLVNISNIIATMPFSAVDGDNWDVVGVHYKQSNINGIQRTVYQGDSFANYWAKASFRFNQLGDDFITDPEDNLSMAGILLRADYVGINKGDGYYCGIDVNRRRLFIAKTEDDDLNLKKFTLFAETSSDPGKAINQEIALDQDYSLIFRAEGSSLVCTALLPDHSQVEFSYQDSSVSRGKFAIFTLGASASFSAVKACVN